MHNHIHTLDPVHHTPPRPPHPPPLRTISYKGTVLCRDKRTILKIQDPHTSIDQVLPFVYHCNAKYIQGHKRKRPERLVSSLNLVDIENAISHTRPAQLSPAWSEVTIKYTSL